jgi:hypothetical protein
MTPRRLTNVRLDDELIEVLQTIKERDGIPISEQIRRAIRDWAEARGVKVKTGRKHAGARKRP